MKKLLLVTTALVAFAAAGPAGAADLPVKARPMAPVAPVLSWSGCSISGGIGYGMWNQDEFTNLPAGATSATVINGGRGWLGRVGAGCDYQIAPSFVIGAFGDFDFMNLKGNNSPPDTVGGGVFSAPGNGDEKENSAWYAGARVGYLPYPNLMTFVSGGWTQTHFNQVDLFATTLGGAVIGVSLPSQTYQGWFIGGGTEYALPWTAFHGLFWKTEYRFSTYRAQNLGFFTTATGVPTGLFENQQKEVQTVTTSLVWRFNWGGPVAARY